MTPLDLEALRAAPVGNEPFRHVLVRHAVPAEALGGVIADLPPIGKGGSFPIPSLRLGPHAAALVRAMEGTAVRDALADRLGIDLHDAPTMLTLRGQARARDGAIHTDSVAKRVTVLLYLNQPTEAWARQEGCLRLLRGPGDLEDFAVEVPPVDGTLLAFVNGPTAWHGHRSFAGPRTVMQLNYMQAGGAARAELRRHRISALLKRLLPAA